MVKIINNIKKEICNLLKNGKTISEISRIVFNTNSTAKLNKYISENGIDISEYSSRYLFMNEQWLTKALYENKTILEICRKYNMPRTSVTRYAKKFGLYESKFTREKENKIIESYFENIDNARKAYWLGFIMADGNIYLYKDSNKIQFSLKIQKSDEKLIHNFANDIGFNQEKIRTGEAKRNDTITQYVELRSYNTTFCKNLMKYGICPQKTGREIIPKKIPYDLKKDFIRGFFDGDGHISKSSVEYCTASAKMIADMSTWFCLHDIFTTINYSKNNIFTVKISKKSVKRFLDIVYYNGCFGLERKTQEAKKIKESTYKSEIM